MKGYDEVLSGYQPGSDWTVNKPTFRGPSLLSSCDVTRESESTYYRRSVSQSASLGFEHLAGTHGHVLDFERMLGCYASWDTFPHVAGTTNQPKS